MQARLMGLAGLLLAAAVSGACLDEQENAAGAQLRPVTATELKFSPSRLSVKAGSPVQITLKNKGTAEHDFVISGMPAKNIDDDTRSGSHDGEHDHSAETGVIAGHAKPGATARIWFTPVERGRYEFYCSVTGHREAGMVGVITVE
jgi:uncharacterized cupredoxin-like copper-binding protein